MTMRDPNTPVPGRTFYAGRWRTPEEVERRKAMTRRNASTHRARQQRSASYRERYANDPVFRERELERNRRNYKPRVRRTSLTPEEQARRRAEKNLRAREERAEARRQRQAIKAAEVRHATQAPAAVRAVWRKAKPGSIMRRKWPTMADLNASVGSTDWSRFV